jgi:chemotaxis protein MotC
MIRQAQPCAAGEGSRFDPDLIRKSGIAGRRPYIAAFSIAEPASRARKMTLAACLRVIALGLLTQLAAVSACEAQAPSQDRARALRETSGLPPYELVRTLESLQDQVVLGSSDAQAKVPKQLGQIAAGILASNSGVWDDPRNLRAVIVYAASGGQPRAVRAVAELGVASGEMKDLLDGMLAYVEGRDARAMHLLAPIDALALPAPLAGHVALVQANLVAREDPRKAMQLLSRARVLAAGTLVEEAALRKQIFLADQGDDLDSFASLSSQYIRRFDRSAYAANFRERFKAAVLRFGLTSDKARFARLEAALGVLGSEEEIQLLLATARAGLLAGSVEPARRAIETAVSMARQGTAEAARATLYAAAMHILTGEIDAGLAELQSLETARLAKPDVELERAVRALASDIRAQPSVAQPAGAEPKPVDEAVPGGRERPASAAAAALIQRAETVLGEIGALLERKLF